MVSELSGKKLSPIALGCGRIGSFNNPASVAETRRLLRAALDLGISVFDTADVYGQGDSERELGRLLSRQSNAAFVLTKVGKRFSTTMRLLRPLKPLLKPLLPQRMRTEVTSQRERQMSADFSPQYVIQAVEGSLRRLRTDALDGLALHSPPAAAIKSPEIGETLRTLHRSGKVKSFGVSCDDLATLHASLMIPGLSLLELPYDILSQISGSELQKQLVEKKIRVFAREVISLQSAIDPAQAIRRAAQMSFVTTVIVGTTRLANLRSAIAAAGAPREIRAKSA